MQSDATCRTVVRVVPEEESGKRYGWLGEATVHVTIPPTEQDHTNQLWKSLEKRSRNSRKNHEP
ncbi:hypothetical protein HAX54_019630, partial [Datura stramonium]|nr:hypothetical protein [Datura stramonium]